MQGSRQSAIHSRAQVGMEAPVVTVETHLSGGLPGFTLVGLPATAVREARDRVRSALSSCGFRFPKGRVVVNLAPGDLTKEGPRYDLAIAASILCATGQATAGNLSELEFLGELSLDGSLRPVRGALCAALACGQQSTARHMIVPLANAVEALALGAGPVLALSHLSQLPALLSDPRAFTARFQASAQPLADDPAAVDAREPHAIDQIVSQPAAKRALLIAAAGGHHLLLMGPPGSGKTMLARALAGLLPPLTQPELLEVAAVHSAAGLPSPGSQRPFREPHHSSSATALVGGGRVPKPGEISLAHRGVLFLDELPHFNVAVLNLLREPLVARSISIARAHYRTRFPACFALVAAMNPCPSGRICEMGQCRCSPAQARAYRARISGPLLDRIDLQIAVPAVPQRALLEQALGQAPTHRTGAAYQRLVSVARARQLARQGTLNAEVRFSRPPLTAGAQALLGDIAARKPLSARAFHRLLKVARTIADLERIGPDAVDDTAEDRPIGTGALAEAFGYRQLDWDDV